MELEWEWVQCDKCQKWRGLRLEDFRSAVQKEKWYCFQHPDAQQANCDTPQILTDFEIDAIYRKRELARAKKSVHPVIWQEISGNVYTYKRRKSWKEDDIAICQCCPDAGKGCLENCINRMLNIECTPGFCPCGPACTNQRFSGRQHAPVKIGRAGMKGFGLFSTEAIQEGDFVTEYMGEIVDEGEYLRRRTFYAENGHQHYYFMQIGNGEVIDACRMGNAGRFMNHSCSPNCETQKWVVKGDLRVGFFAIRTIQAGEELTFNYNFQTEKPIRCCCGASNCNGTIGGQKSTEEIPDEVLPEGGGKEIAEVPDPIMMKEEEMDEVMRVILAKQVGLPEEVNCSVDQIRTRLRGLYLKHGLELLASSLELEGVTDSAGKGGTREVSSGESSEQQTSSGSLSRSSLRRRLRGRSRTAMAGGLSARAGKLGAARPRPELERRRSEVDSSLADITASSGKLYNPSRKNILKVLRLFNLIEIGMNEKEQLDAELARERERQKREELERSGQVFCTASRSQARQQPVYVAGYCIRDTAADEETPTPRQRAQFADLSLLLDVVQHTIDPSARKLFVECGILSQLQQVVGRNFAPQYKAMLRKILRVVDCLPLQRSDFEKARSAHGTMGHLITALTHHKDNGVRSMALSIARQQGLETEATQKQKQPQLQSSEREAGSLERSRSWRTHRPSSRETGSLRRGSCASTATSALCGSENAISPDGKGRRGERDSEGAGSLSLPPGFGYHRSQYPRDQEPELSQQWPDSRDTVSRETGRDLSPHTVKRKREIRERIVRKLQSMHPPQTESLFVKEIGKASHFAETNRQELRAREVEEQRQKRQKLIPHGEGSYDEMEGWDHLSRDFESFVRQTLRQRIQKYQQPEHPLRLSATEAEQHFRKLFAAIMESEEQAFKSFAGDGLRRHVSKVKLALNIKEFTSKSMHDYYRGSGPVNRPG